MSILIKSMEMPDRCFSCPMLDSDCCGISRGSYIEYREVDVDVALDSRPDWCPLIPVPDHGRLIDADKLPWYLKDVTEILDATTIIEADKEDNNG